MSAGAYLFLGIFVAAAVRPFFCKIRGDSTCYWASALLEMLFIPSRHHLLLHLIGKRKRTLRLVVNRDVAERVRRGIHQNVLQVICFFPVFVQWFKVVLMVQLDWPLSVVESPLSRNGFHMGGIRIEKTHLQSKFPRIGHYRILEHRLLHVLCPADVLAQFQFIRRSGEAVRTERYLWVSLE